MTFDKPKITILVDTERSYLSVNHLVRSPENPEGRVIRVRAPGYKQAQDALFHLMRQTLPDLKDEEYKEIGAVCLDTISIFATNVRRDIIASNASTQGLSPFFDAWTNREKLFPQLRDWGSMTDLIGRLMQGFSSWADQEGVPFIIAAHERLAEDEITKAKKGSPDANAALLADINGNSDYVWRIWCEDGPVKVDGTQYPAGTHFIRLAGSENKMTKRRLPPEITARMPANLPSPTLVKAFGYLGPFIPNVLTVFGPPGAGKTTFLCSLSDPKNFAKAAA